MPHTTSISSKDKATVHAYASKEAAKEAGREALNAFQHAESNIRDTAERLGQEARQVVDNVARQTREVTSEVRGRIEQQPVQSTLYALGIGAVLGFLFSRR